MEKSLLFLITSIVFVNAQTIDYPLFQGTFDGTVYDEENGTFVFPSSAQSWAGFANVNENIYPLYFPTGGKVQFTANTSTNVEVYFRFEANPYPNVDPAQNTNTVTILATNSGTNANVYQVDIPSSGSNTYNSALLYLVTRDVEVEIRNIKIITNETASFDYILAWADEFDNDENTYFSNQINPVDPSKWFHQTYPANGGQVWFNNEEQHYTDRIDNSYVSDGTLKIKAIKETYSNLQTGSSQNYTSARLNSKYAFNFGKVDVRAKLPSAQGTWPAIWTLGQNISEQGAYWQTQGLGTTGWPACGEIDIMEQDSNKSITSGAFHFGPDYTQHQYTTDHISVTDTEKTWHVYSMIWTDEGISLMVDGVEFHNTSNVEMSYFQANHFILLNVAMGGALGGSIASDFSSAIMEIDYVRVYQLQSLLTPSTLKKELLLYPNPSDGSFQIESGIQIEEVHIYNLNGQKLQSFQPNKKVFTIHSDLPKGLYLAEISGSNFREIKRLMVK
jgi:beta-glucanase (GH16 family)